MELIIFSLKFFLMHCPPPPSPYQLGLAGPALNPVLIDSDQISVRILPAASKFLISRLISMVFLPHPDDYQRCRIRCKLTVKLIVNKFEHGSKPKKKIRKWKHKGKNKRGWREHFSRMGQKLIQQFQEETNKRKWEKNCGFSQKPEKSQVNDNPAGNYMFKVDNKDTRTTQMASFWYLYC